MDGLFNPNAWAFFKHLNASLYCPNDEYDIPRFEYIP